MNAVTYKDIFCLIRENKIWLGYTQPKIFIDAKRNITQEFGNICWYSNLNIKKRTEILETIASYKKNPEKYPKYDNYDAINVDRNDKIPMDYDGVMGVPITFVTKHNPKQFKILGLSTSAGYDKYVVHIPFLGLKDARATVNGATKYARILIRKIAEVKELKKEEQEKIKKEQK